MALGVAVSLRHIVEIHQNRRMDKRCKFAYKAERKGKLLVKVDQWFPSSKTCIACGHIHKELKLSDRTYVCPKCGHAMDRDKQAARNILNEAKRMTGAA